LLHYLAALLLQSGYDPATGSQLAHTLTGVSRPAEWRAHAHLLLGCEKLAAGRWAEADSEFAVAEQLAPEDGLPYRALFALSSPIAVPDSTLAGLARRVRAWDAARVPDRHGNRLSAWAALDGSRPVVRQYLIALLDLRLGNAAAASERADALGLEPDSDSLGSLPHDYSATINASVAAAKDDPVAALRSLETQRFVVLDYRFIWPFHSHGIARLLRASALARVGREDEALGWLEGLMAAELSVLDRQFLRAPAYRLAGEIHGRRGARQQALEAYGRFVELWREGDPAAQEQVKAVRERMAALAAEP
jgi:hypothetical protein